MRKVAAAVVLVIFTALGVSAQENWGGGVDDEVLHFGFTFQYVNSEFKVLRKPDWRTPFNDRVGPDQADLSDALLNDTLYSVSSAGSPGFGIGFVSDFRLSDRLNLRFTPNLVFADRIMYYEYLRTGRVVDRKVESTLIDLPLGIKLKSDRRKNFRAYIIAGTKYSMDIISKKKLSDGNLILSERFLKNRRTFSLMRRGLDSICTSSTLSYLRRLNFRKVFTMSFAMMRLPSQLL